MEEYQKMNASQRKTIRRNDLQALLDEHIQEGEINSIRGIIREELDSKFDALKKELAKTFESKIKKVSEDVTNLMSENNTLKKVVLQQQHFLENIRRERTKENIFVSGIPNILTIDGEDTEDPKKILDTVMKFVCPTLGDEGYEVLVNFEPKEGYSSHSAKIRTKDSDTKAKIFTGTAKLKALGENHAFKKVYLKYDNPPLTRKENDRLHQRMRTLRAEENADNPVNKYYIKSGKLYKNGTCIDEFNLSHQLFQ